MKKRMVIISGFSGAGKGSVIHRLMEIDEMIFKNQSKIWLSVSDTSRAMRNKEDNYNFISIIDYQKRVNEGYYLEYNCYDENGYGTPRVPVIEALGKGKTVILEIDRNGMEQILSDESLIDVDIITIFICVNANTLQARLLHRGDSKDNISRRMIIAYNELSHLSKYDHIFINDDIDKTALRVWAVIHGLPVSDDIFSSDLFYQR